MHTFIFDRIFYSIRSLTSKTNIVIISLFIEYIVAAQTLPASKRISVNICGSTTAYRTLDFLFIPHYIYKNLFINKNF
jgi:hypothetical protein